MAGNALVGQSGGPTSVINASLAGVVDAAVRSKQIGRVFGMRFGIEGVLGDFLLDLGAEPAETIKGLRSTPSSALGSSRLKLREEHFDAILKRLKRYDIRYYFMIGGNDTMDTIHRVVAYAHSQGWDMTGVGVPKTVDNDLFGTDHTPGYPSAARYVALSVQQGALLARDMQRVDQFTVFQTVGRSAGWLPAAAACVRRKSGDAPHLILLPERHFDRERFLEAVAAAHKKQGFVSIVCGEGITNPDGSPVSASTTTDAFKNVEFGAGGGGCGRSLHRMISDEFLAWDSGADTAMCAADRTVKLDVVEAYACGKEAVSLALRGSGGVMVTIERTSKPGGSTSRAGTIPLAEVANHARPMPDNMIGADGMDVTKAFVNYAQPLVGELPEYANLTIRRAKP